MCSFFSRWICSSYCCISFIFHTFFYLSLWCISFLKLCQNKIKNISNYSLNITDKCPFNLKHRREITHATVATFFYLYYMFLLSVFGSWNNCTIITRFMMFLATATYTMCSYMDFYIFLFFIYYFFFFYMYTCLYDVSLWCINCIINCIIIIC